MNPQHLALATAKKEAEYNRSMYHASLKLSRDEAMKADSQESDVLADMHKDSALQFLQLGRVHIRAYHTALMVIDQIETSFEQLNKQ